ncbi:hypothetical protein [Olivibacter domesticus]|uniref:Uncharacterized protein n=1 Tax=Olivibacter domesticus TaxID=407022 RepID=A0A1H7Z497_OLID1|nr:hypothetical protein [Olivibacter domesticus]SEM52378.1 hypothetical protein SAMN05661044_05393 [Olivibacter domesticus]
MVETFTSKINDLLDNNHEVYDDLQLNAEDRLFYAMLNEPLNALLKQPSVEAVHSILDFSSKYSEQSH